MISEQFPRRRTAAMIRRATALLWVAAAAVLGAATPGPESAPLAPRSGPRGVTLFTWLDAARTGIHAENRYDDPAMWRERYREFSLGSVGTGVAIGDFDGDGRPDVFVVCKLGPNHLFRNLGDFRFEDVTASAGVGGPAGGWYTGAAFVDVNNDGRLDLYVCRNGAANLLFINQGDGTFREEAHARGLDVVDASGMAAFCDYDRDGWLDVYLQTNLLDGDRRPNGQRDRLFHNNRDGTFTEVTDAAGIRGETQGHSATWWDFDEDGWPDLYVANDFRDADQLYHNNRDGTFTNVLDEVVPHTPHSSMGADLGDLDNDGHLDLLVADMAATSRYKDQRGMARLRAGLMEEDASPATAPQYMRNALFLGTGRGRVLEAAELAGLATTDWTWSVRLEDLDLDGRVDAYFTNGMVRELHNADLMARMMAKDSLADRIRLMKASPPLAERHLAFRNLGDLRFEETGAAWGLDQVGVGFGAAFGDLDGDGDLDLVYASYQGDVTVCRNDCDTGHALLLDLRGTASNRFGVGATVRLETAAGRQVRTLTLARGYQSTSEPVVHFGLGNETVVRRVTVDWPSGRRQEFTGLAADRRYTLVEAGEPEPRHPASRPQFMEEGAAVNFTVASTESAWDDRARQPLLPWRLNHVGPALQVAEDDAGSGVVVAVGGANDEAGRMLAAAGAGPFTDLGPTILANGSSLADGPMVPLDANGDGRLDWLVTKAGTAAPAGAAAYEPRLWWGDGPGRFKPAPAGVLPSLPISVGAAVAADFEHSGRLGLFLGGRVTPWRYPEPPRSVLLAWRRDRFVDVTAELAPSLAARGMVAAALWTDVNGDGWPDLVVAYEWGPVACYLNRGGHGFEDATERLGFAGAGNGWWSALAVADVNGDGRPDLIVGNAGLNTRYRATPEAPAVLYSGVAADGVAGQLIEAEAEAGRWYPVRTRETLARVFPSLGRRFPTAESYATAGLDDVFPGGVLDRATRLTVTELRSGVFLSQPDGTYRFTPLPRLAQIAPIHAILAADFTGDGRTDLLVVGNSFAPWAETGRFDGGLGWLLAGDGRGGFTPVPPAESGVAVPGDARAAALLDLDRDGWPEVVVTRNNNRALLFRNAGRPGAHSFGVRLSGPPGNPAAVGARVQVTLADGATQTAEVAAGGGFSPGPSVLYFGYPHAAVPVSLAVRWPDGRTTTQRFDRPPPARLNLSAR